MPTTSCWRGDNEIAAPGPGHFPRRSGGAGTRGRAVRALARPAHPHENRAAAACWRGPCLARAARQGPGGRLLRSLGPPSMRWTHTVETVIDVEGSQAKGQWKIGDAIAKDLALSPGDKKGEFYKECANLLESKVFAANRATAQAAAGSCVKRCVTPARCRGMVSQSALQRWRPQG
jgi:hypothetical protein